MSSLNSALVEGFSGGLEAGIKGLGEAADQFTNSYKEGYRYGAEVERLKKIEFTVRQVRRPNESAYERDARVLDHERKLSNALQGCLSYEEQLGSLVNLFIINNCAEELVQYYERGDVMPLSRVNEIYRALDKEVKDKLGIRLINKDDAGVEVSEGRYLTEYEINIEPAYYSSSFLRLMTKIDAEKGAVYISGLIKTYEKGGDPFRGTYSSLDKPFGLGM